MTDAEAVVELEFLDDFLNERIPSNPVTMARASNADFALRHAIQVLKDRVKNQDSRTMQDLQGGWAGRS